MSLYSRLGVSSLCDVSGNVFVSRGCLPVAKNAACLFAAFLGLALKLSSAAAPVQDFGLVSVGSSSAPTGVTIQLTQTVANPSVSLLYGVEFSVSGCTPSQNSIACNVTFSPTAPGLRQDILIVKDGTGSITQTKLVQGTGSGPQIVIVPGKIAQLNLNISGGFGTPASLATDQFGNVYFAQGAAIGLWNRSSGTITTVAGTGSGGYSGDGGPATQAQLSWNPNLAPWMLLAMFTLRIPAITSSVRSTPRQALSGRLLEPTVTRPPGRTETAGRQRLPALPQPTFLPTQQGTSISSIKEAQFAR